MENSSLPFNPSVATSLLKALEKEWTTRQSHRRLTSYKPYSKQAEFHAAGHFRERLLMAGNQLGKTLAAGMETAMHLTGQYPDWWPGRRWDRPVIGWASGVTGESTRDNPQRILLGRPGSWGTGAIPKSAIVETPSSARGLADAVDTIRVRHVSGDTSSIQLKSYEKGREKWQGETLDFLWFDEEPPMDIYTEGLTRTNATGGMTFVTFTPLLGMSNVVKRFLLDKMPGTHVTTMTIEDAEHFTAQQREAIVGSYQPYERDARTRGIPQLGSGRVFQVAQEQVACKPFDIPKHWPQIGGLDFGWDHPSAAVKMAWNRDADILYVIATHRQREQTPAIFSAALRPWGGWMPWAWPHDGLQHDKGSGEQLAAQYKTHGLKMLPDRATFRDGSNGVEAGVAEMLDRMQTGRWKVFDHLTDWFEEFNLYHRKEGLIVKLSDDLISASRYAMMMRRYAKTNEAALPLKYEMAPA